MTPPVTADRLAKILGRRIEWLTTADLVRDYKFPSANAARQFLYRHQVPFTNRGRVVLVDRRDLNAACTQHRHTLRKKAS